MRNMALWHRVRAVAYAFEGFTEQPPGSNRGQVVDRLATATGYAAKDAVPWCACLVYYAGWRGLYDPVSRKSAWPLPKTGGCAALGEFAEAKGVLLEPTRAQVGDVFLVWYESLGRFAHTGFLIYGREDGSWTTLDGNTSKPGDTNPATAREGWGTFERTRTLKAADRVIRWTDLPMSAANG